MNFYAKDIMSRKLITAHPAMMCEEVMELLIANRITGAPVVNSQGVLLGVITLFDLVSNDMNLPYAGSFFEASRLDALLSDEGLHLELVSEGAVSDYMTHEVFTATPETPVEELARTMYLNRIHRIIILKPNEQIPMGIVTTFDLLKVIAEDETFSAFREKARELQVT